MAYAHTHPLKRDYRDALIVGLIFLCIAGLGYDLYEHISYKYILDNDMQMSETQATDASGSTLNSAASK